MTCQRIRFAGTLIVCAATVLVSTGCSSPAPGNGDNDGTCDLTEPTCGEGLVCEVAFGSEDGLCAAPVTIRGVVLDIADDTPIEGALVQAADVNGAAVGTSGQTDAEGAYEIVVPVTRDENGDPITRFEPRSDLPPTRR